MYKPLLNEPTFLENLQNKRKAYIEESDKRSKAAVETLKQQMPYNDIKTLNIDVDYIMSVLINSASKKKGVNLSLKCTSDSALVGIKAICNQYMKLTKDQYVTKNNIFNQMFWEHVNRANTILATALAEKTGISYETEYRKTKTGICITKEKDGTWLAVWWL